jgi:hypothetical protein
MNNNRNDTIPVAFSVGLIIGVTMSILCMVTTHVTHTDGYRQAYEDLKKGTIESVTKRIAPDLWIKYNAPEEKKDGGDIK